MNLILLTFGLFVAGGSARTLERPAASTSDEDFFTIFINQKALKDTSKTDPPPETPASVSADSNAQDPKGKAAGYARRKDGYEDDDDDDDDDYSGHRGVPITYKPVDDNDDREEDPYYATALFCRMAVYPFAKNPDECANVKIKDYAPDFIYDNPHKTEAKGKCYWDLHLGKIDQQSGCLCPRSKVVCEKLKQCYWHVLPNPGKHKDDKKKSKYGRKRSKDDEGDDHGHCIHNSERFYNLLAKLLQKRGKKDLSLQIKYSSAPAKGKLPYGPYGPAIIGGDAERQQSYLRYRDNQMLYDRNTDSYMPYPQYQEYPGPPPENYYPPPPLGYHPEPQVYVEPNSDYGHREGYFMHQGYVADPGHFGCQQPHHMPYDYNPVMEHHPYQPELYGQLEPCYEPGPLCQPGYGPAAPYGQPEPNGHPGYGPAAPYGQPEPNSHPGYGPAAPYGQPEPNAHPGYGPAAPYGQPEPNAHLGYGQPEPNGHPEPYRGPAPYQPLRVQTPTQTYN